jgi:2'-5' RNA ligase
MRMFVAVWPDHATRRRIEALALQPGPHVRLVDPAQWHVTLRFLGDVDDRLIPELSDALMTVARVIAGPVQCRLAPATGWFNGSRVLYLPVTGLDRLAEAVRASTVPVILLPDGASRLSWDTSPWPDPESASRQPRQPRQPLQPRHLLPYRFRPR